jgi:hypothetical protein
MGIWTADTSTYGFTQIPLPVRMRALPTIGISNYLDFSFNTPGTVSGVANDSGDQSTIMGILKINGSGFTNLGMAYSITTSNKVVGAAYIDFNAEL